MKAHTNQTKWARPGDAAQLAIMGKDVIMYGAGCHLYFFNVITGEDHLYTANTHETGDGIACYNSFRSQYIFAFTEKCNHPRIFIKNYPAFDEVFTLKCEARGHTSIVFSDSFLISLGDLPNFMLTVWNWRTGVKMANHETSIFNQDQLLRCNFGSAEQVAQLAVNTNILHFWDVMLCGKKCVLTEHIVKPPKDICNPFTNILWTTEGGLFVLDSIGCVYTMLPDHSLEKIIESDESGEFETSFVYYKGGIVICGPGPTIRQFKKCDSWTINWELEPPEPIKKIIARGDLLIGISTNDNILQLHHSEECQFLRKHQAQFNDFCMVYPLGEYIVALLANSVLSCFELDTGNLVSTYELKTKVLAMVNNPKFPVIIIGYENGFIELVSYYEVDNPKKMTVMNLTRSPIDYLYFNECGTIFLAANHKIGLFFVIEGLPGGQMEVIGVAEGNHQVAHSMIVMSQNCYRIFTIPVTHPKHLAGNKIVRYCIIKERGTNVKEYKFRDKKALYKQLIPTFGLNRDRKFYAVPFYGRGIEDIEIKRGDNVAKVMEKVVTGHQMRNVSFVLDKNFAYSWAYDGLVLVRRSDFVEQIGIALTHHRYDGGVKKAIVDPYGKYVATLGYDNVLVSTDFVENDYDDALHDSLEDILTSMTYALLFSKPTLGFNPNTGKYAGKCYLEYKAMKLFEKEKELCKKEKSEIKKEFKSIQKSLQHLLTENIEGPENEYLDLLEFNLDVDTYRTKYYRHQKVCKATDIYLRELIVAQNAVADLMIKQFWDKTEVPTTRIHSIFANFDVTNYALMPPNLEQEALVAWIMQQRLVEKFLSNDQPFKPWLPTTDDDLLNTLQSKPRVQSDEKMKILEMTQAVNSDEDEEEIVVDKVAQENERKRVETELTMTGSDLGRFLTPEATHYVQYHLDTYYQSRLQWILTKCDTYKLKKFFNKEFNTVMTYKSKEMSGIKERDERLHVIVYEINYHSVEKIEMTIIDPEWDQTENPSTIIQVKDAEVPITPYISPSEQKLIDARAAEAERLRLLMLADDFRERALMAMMNGVLEVRWEDELKKNVPIPKCMIEKEPEHFNEEDLRVVRDYEEAVRFLNSERERYKNMLRTEYAKVSTSVRDSIRKFNGKLSDLILLKLDVDSALSQEAMKINRLKLCQLKRKKLDEKIILIQEEIGDNFKLLDSLIKMQTSLNVALSEVKSVLEGIQWKDKFLDKAFKKEFQDMSVIIQEQANKFYKKRPKVNFRTINSAVLLNELAKCIINDTMSIILNPECVDFIKQVRASDMFIGIPPVVDEATYAQICKHRRLRIEFDIRVKALQNEIAIGEATIATFHKRIIAKRELQIQLNHNLEQVRYEILDMQKDKEIQIVLPRGFVEIALTGSFSDFEDAMLISRKDVEHINSIILNGGVKKMKALQMSMGFKRKIQVLEWEHKRKKMQIQDLQEKIIDVNSVRMTRDVQMHFKNKQKKQDQPFESEIDWMRASYENSIQDRRERIRKIRHQIKSLQRHNKQLTQQITETNVDICEFNLMKDKNLPERTKAVIDKRMKVLLERNKMVQEIEESHHQLLVLQTELELLRLKTYPTLKYRVL